MGYKKQKKEDMYDRGFALLLTLVVISVILAVGLSLLHITLKQFTLSSIARDSEIAFHAANSGIECMRYHRSQSGTLTDFLNGGAAPSVTCAGVSPDTLNNAHGTASGEDVYNYQYTYDVSDGNDVCIETSMYLMDNTSSSQINYAANEGLDTISCPGNALCTVIFSRGYNRPCNSLNSILTVQRELTVLY